MTRGEEKLLLDEIRSSVRRGRNMDTVQLVRQGLEGGICAETILNDGLVPAMRNFGKYQKEEQVDIPGILLAARSMKKGLNILEPYLEKSGKMHIGTAILGTVEGDLHEVGKNLVSIMLKCAGIDVIDLGVDVTEKQFVKTFREHPEVSVVCISSLLITSKKQMRKSVQALRKSDHSGRLKIMVGGGSVSKETAMEMGADAYTETAVDAAEIAKEFILSKN